MIDVSIVVALAAILTTTSLIIFGKASANYKLRHSAQDFASQVERARSIAIKENRILTLGFTSENRVFGLTCSDCARAKSELPQYSIPSDIQPSAYPTMTIRGNGTISTTAGSITFNDNKGRRVMVTVNSGGRVIVGDVF